MRAKELIRYLAWYPGYEVLACGKLDKPTEYFGIRVDEEHRRIYLEFWPGAEGDFRVLKTGIDQEELGGKDENM